MLSAFGQNIRFLCIAEVYHQGVLVVLISKVLMIVFGVCILCDVGFLQVDLLQLELCGLNHLLPSKVCQVGVMFLFYGFKVSCVLMVIVMWDVGISILSMWGIIPIQGLSCTSVVGGHSRGLIGVTVGLVGIS